MTIKTADTKRITSALSFTTITDTPGNNIFVITPFHVVLQRGNAVLSEHVPPEMGKL